MKDDFEKAATDYATAVGRLVGESTTTEASYYAAVDAFLTAALRARGLPFDVRAATSEARRGGGRDLPDLAFYDGPGGFAVVCVEVKRPDADVEETALSQDRDDQIGRYLDQTRAVIVTNVRSFALVVDAGDRRSGPVPPGRRRIEQVAELWPSTAAMRRGAKPATAATTALADLVETAVTRFAPIAQPESLARILARQARLAKEGLPPQFGSAVKGLVEDFGAALGIKFEGEEGEAFFRSSLIQTAYYAMFAGWVLHARANTEKPFRWTDLGEYLKIPFLGRLFHEFKHPDRLKDLRLAARLDTAEETLARVDRVRFFARFRGPALDSVDETPSAESAITYFYEPFLEAFDPDLRKELGVWYTPPEIVRYQVRRIDRLLREELGCSRGLADEKVVVLDPCCGTGAYLIETLRCIAARMKDEGDGGLLGSRLLEAVCRRVVGFEILTAPFVVAQLQLYLLLSELGAEPGEDDRPAVFGFFGPVLTARTAA